MADGSTVTSRTDRADDAARECGKKLSLAVAWLGHPEWWADDAFASGGGDEWDLSCIGWTEQHEHPRDILDPATLELAEMWFACRGPDIQMAFSGGVISIPGARAWPDAGGVADQAAYVVRAFRVMDATWAKLRAESRLAAGGDAS